MITFNLDKSGNRVVIKMSGNISTDEAIRNLNEFVDMCKELEDNFTIINDISEINIDTEAKLITLNKVHMKIFELFKVGKIIRIIGKSKSVLIQLSKIDKKFNLKNIHYVPTMKEAVDLAEE